MESVNILLDVRYGMYMFRYLLFPELSIGNAI